MIGCAGRGGRSTALALAATRVRSDKGVAMARNSMLLPVYVPTALLAFGQGLLVPTLPVYALELGASASLVGLIVGLLLLLALLAPLPSSLDRGQLAVGGLLLGTLRLALTG